MSHIEEIAAQFRTGLIPSVAKKLPWSKMTVASQDSYVQATHAALAKIVAEIIQCSQREAETEIAALQAKLAAIREIAAEGDACTDATAWVDIVRICETE